MTLDLLEQALLSKRGREAPPKIVEDLQRSSSQDLTELLPHLKKRALELAETAKAQLAERGKREARDMAEILEAQKKRIEATATKYQSLQLRLDFGGDEAAERRQLESNRRHWVKRLAAIGDELATEPARIRDLYQVKAQRIEPVGLVYLWPVTG